LLTATTVGVGLVSFVVVGRGMFGVAVTRHLSPHADVTVVGPDPAAGGREAYGAHHDEGRIIREVSRDPLWIDLVRRARAGMSDLDASLVVPCGVLTATTQSGPDYLGVAKQIRSQRGADVRTLTPDAVRSAFPNLRFGPDESILYEPAAGHFSPRRYVALATARARAHGTTVMTGTVRTLRSSSAGVEIDLDDGSHLRADTVVIATGAFAAGSHLLPRALALRAKSEVYAMAELSDDQVRSLTGMPAVVRTVSHPDLADLYVLPPIRYPDGRVYIKVGANTMTDHWLDDPAQVRDWYHHGDSDNPLPAFREVLTDLLPHIEARSWHTRRCADAYTAHRRPYIGAIEPGRLIVALGGNGRSAQAADAIGAITAELALTGRWTTGLPPDTFQLIPAHNTWAEMTLLTHSTSDGS
jgi:sarcosine oxidase